MKIKEFYRNFFKLTRLELFPPIIFDNSRATEGFSATDNTFIFI